MERVPTDDNVADPLMKVLSQCKFEHHLESMGIRYEGVISSRLSGRLLEICPRASDVIGLFMYVKLILLNEKEILHFIVPCLITYVS